VKPNVDHGILQNLSRHFKTGYSTPLAKLEHLNLAKKTANYHVTTKAVIWERCATRSWNDWVTNLQANHVFVSW